jgi:N-methylhydantoinase A/oxoprolinase/acetone carboxylase beta subunit
MLRIGVDVGGTHTDAVLLRGQTIESHCKVATTLDTTSGVLNAINTLVAGLTTHKDIGAVMIGTSHSLAWLLLSTEILRNLAQWGLFWLLVELRVAISCLLTLPNDES